jgi:hypothetical protein
MTELDGMGELDEIEAVRSRLVAHADTAHEAIRAVNHATIRRRPLPAPFLAPVLGTLTRLGPALAQACEQLTHALTAAADTYPLGTDDASDPLTRLLDAEDHLHHAARHAHALGEHLTSAHTALSHHHLDLDDLDPDDLDPDDLDPDDLDPDDLDPDDLDPDDLDDGGPADA